MVRNLDHRLEAAAFITEPTIAQELKGILEIQLKDNVKARLLDNELNNNYADAKGRKVRAQVETYNFLQKKLLPQNAG
jgi:polyphosphate kinase